ncbi:DeoR/GlpR family DNA-binding transcription regulator [Nakamurella endophytica]|uniref:Transcriptional regulator n=1 Tax=Nakamurella endophytica TaxID=1748367 RepID=A0A917STT3_9ACTN|nr:DeoR/GlpR family DNA-binding transcription regulator [Nakamurella endophytica]GGL95394.1 transcriptional regulator [Nakamurella endophytica]
MGSHERWTGLLDILGRDGRLDVLEAATELAVSPATIRRDLDHLAAQQLLSRTRGGAVPASVAYDLPLRYKTGRHTREKSRIGAAAAALVPAGSVVGVNGGTTTSEFARALVTTPPNGSPAVPDGSAPASVDPDGARAVDLDGGGADAGLDHPVFTVVTNALNIANDLAVRRTVKLVVVGGVARPSSYELIGPLAESSLLRLHLDFMVLGVDGFDLATGATAHHEGEAAVSAAMAEHASTVIVVADASKLGMRRFARICPTTSVDVLVTDAGADPVLLQRFRDAGVRVKTA